jgi:hypothetical protein
MWPVAVSHKLWLATVSLPWCHCIRLLTMKSLSLADATAVANHSILMCLAIVVTAVASHGELSVAITSHYCGQPKCHRGRLVIGEPVVASLSELTVTSQSDNAVDSRVVIDVAAMVN